MAKKVVKKLVSAKPINLEVKALEKQLKAAYDVGDYRLHLRIEMQLQKIAEER